MINGYWFWLSIVCLSLNLGLLNSTLSWWYLVTCWAMAIIVYYFIDRFWMTCVIVGICLTCWGIRENSLNNQLVGHGKKQVNLRIHRDDLTWREGYLSGLATNEQGNYVRVHGKCLMPPKGEVFQLSSLMQVDAIEQNRNRFNFNPQQYWRTKNIVLDYELLCDVQWDVENTNSIVDWIKNLHMYGVAWFETLPPGLRDYGQTLLLGYTRHDFYDDNQGIQQLGLIHLFSISGFQVTLCYQVWFWMLRRLGCYREDVQYGWFGMLGFIWLFAGSVQSLIRAVLASGLSNYCDLKQKQISAVDAWGMVLIISQVITPGVCHQLGGQLSFLLSFGLLWLKDSGFWQKNLILNILIAPCLFAQTYSWQPIGILANLVIIPIFTYVVVPVVFAGVMFHAIQVVLLRDVCEILIRVVCNFIELGADIPGEIISGELELWWLITLCICTGIVLVQQRLKSFVGVCLCYGLLIMGIGVPKQAFLAFVDVKQGDATIWRDNHHEVYMLDVGGQYTPVNERKTKGNQVAKQISQFLKGNGIRVIDHLILSHQDIDHIGNFEIVCRAVQIQHIYVPKGMLDTNGYKKQVQPYLSSYTQVHEVLAGDKIGQGECQVIHPFEPGEGTNSDSITLVGAIMGESYLFTGDLDVAGEHKIIQRMQLPQINIFKCGHHGSRTSNSDALLQIIKPEIGIISAGKNNRFKHPHVEVVERLKVHQIKQYVTAEMGMIYLERGKWQTCLEKKVFTDCILGSDVAR